MKPLLLLAPLLAASAAVLPLHAATPADAPPVKFTIDNQQKLVTVKAADSSPLFSTVISTPNLTIEIKPQSTDMLLLLLQDTSGKTLWTKPFASPQGSSLKANTTGSGFIIGLEKSTSPTVEKDDLFQSMLIVIGPDDKFLSLTGHSKNHKLSMLPQKDGIVLTVDGKTTLTQFSKPNDAGEGVFTLFGKKYPFHKVQRNGKTYEDLDWNGKHVLFPPDSKFTINTTEGSPDELIIDTPAAPSQAAPAAPAK